MNKKTVALTGTQYKQIIDIIRRGFIGHRANHRIATALVLQANLGLRIGDIVKLKLNDVVRDGDRWRLNIIEQKTNKKREFTIPNEVYSFIKIYTLENGIGLNDKVFPISARQVQKHLKAACDYLGFIGISTHSFRKFFATQIYIDSGYNIALVQMLLQHESPVTTQKYIGIQCEEVETALRNHSQLL
jgi:integrase